VTSSLQTADGPDGSTPRPVADSRAGRLPSLTGMRFLSAVMVFFFHFGVLGFFASAGALAKYTSATNEGGFAGVVYFFILSGFVLTWSERAGDRLGAFWRRRFVKIYPNYLVAVVLGIVLAVVIEGQPFNRNWAVLEVFLVQSWSPELITRSGFNAPLWSLSAEALFYLCFPLLVRLIDRIRPERLWAWFGGIAAAIVAVPVIAHLLPPGGPLYDDGMPPTEVWLVIHNPATRMLEFVLGIVMARIVLTGRRLPLRLGGAVALSVVAYWASAYVPSRFNSVAIMVVPLALLIAAAAVQDAEGRRSLVSRRVWVWLGEISYAFYLIHFLVQSHARYLLGTTTLSTPVAFALLAGCFVVTIGLAALLHHLVERPMMKHFARSRRDRAESAAELPEEPALAGDGSPGATERRAA
jgi:peptidoglycan/LPS O-acetylase OafA/YrhL